MVSKLKQGAWVMREKVRLRRERWRARKRWRVTLRTRRRKILFLIALTLPFIVLTILLPPIRQDQAYHDFADKRRIFEVTNFMDVSSNLIMLLVGGWGIWVIGRIAKDDQQEAFLEPIEMMPYRVFFWGLLITAIGSYYYHLNPHDLTLVWDRLPMTVGFMALFSTIIMERISFRWGRRMLWPLITLGVLSVVYWYAGVLLGKGGDLRFYANVQYYPMMVIPLIIRYFPSNYTHGWVFGRVVLWYLLAKVVEIGDKVVFSLTGGWVSGHTLKHVVVGMAAYQLIFMLERRRVRDARA